MHVLRDMTFPIKLIQQGAFVAHRGGLMHEALAKIPSFFPEDSKKTSSGTRPSRSRRSIATIRTKGRLMALMNWERLSSQRALTPDVRCLSRQPPYTPHSSRNRVPTRARIESANFATFSLRSDNEAGPMMASVLCLPTHR